MDRKEKEGKGSLEPPASQGHTASCIDRRCIGCFSRKQGDGDTARFTHRALLNHRAGDYPPEPRRAELGFKIMFKKSFEGQAGLSLQLQILVHYRVLSSKEAGKRSRD